MRTGEHEPARVRAPRRAPTRVVALLAASLSLLLALGCAPRPTPAQRAAEQLAHSQKLIDSGNEAYRVGDYRLAARRYAAAAVVMHDDPAAYYGMGMALSKLGRDEEARAAYARARELARTRPVIEGQGARVHSAPAETIPAR